MGNLLSQLASLLRESPNKFFDPKKK